MASAIGDAEEQEWLSTIRAREGVVEGLIKLKLIHAQGFSLLLPELLVAEVGGWKWYQPKFFTACLLHYLDGFAICNLWIDLSEEPPRLSIQFTSGQLVRKFEDGSHLYSCFISGASDLAAIATGTCTVSDDNDLLLDLFHHTTPEYRKAIEESGHFRSSQWNVQGTKKLENVGYAYFTSLPVIQTEHDLQRIAMASDEQIVLMPTNARSWADAVSIRVYRENTWNRRATLKVSVPASAVASQHVYRHAPRGEVVYFELCHPEIFRVGLVPGAVLPFEGGRAQPVLNDLKRFDYVVLGDADTAIGLEAPYDEENTKALFIVERCPDESIFDFWRRNANTDQFNGREFERMLFEPPDDKAD